MDLQGFPNPLCVCLLSAVTIRPKSLLVGPHPAGRPSRATWGLHVCFGCSAARAASFVQLSTAWGAGVRADRSEERVGF